jgi:hypothetical protein
MKRILFLTTLLLVPLTALHAAGPRDTMPDSWAATDELVQLKTCGMCLSGRTTWESVEQNAATTVVDLV